ncbi:MAG: zinc-ribbon domain-containing protein [Myxococcota bacterium]|nr:zinc-ribbon domain-containing protein [Myxococcota bacterium]
MIIECERCQTRFRLDPSRIPATGTRVRCSRCKHAFFVRRPGASGQEMLNAAAEQAARRAAPGAPEPSWDLEEGTTAQPSARAAPAAGPAGSGDAEDGDWQFEDELPDFGGPDSELDPVTPEPGSLDAGDPNETSFADLGDPESWDLTAQSAPAAPPVEEAPPPAPPPAPEAAPEAVPEAAPELPRLVPEPKPTAAAVAPPAPARAAVEAAPAVAREAPPAPAVEPTTASRPRRARRSWAWTGWVAVAAGLGMAVAGLLRPLAPPPSAFAPVAGFEVAGARARILENAVTGPVLVVTGALRNPGPQARALGGELQVSLLDAEGHPLAGLLATAGPTRSERDLRREDPRRLRAQQLRGARELASHPLAPGAHFAFDAVFERLPEAAARFELSLQR